MYVMVISLMLEKIMSTGGNFLRSRTVYEVLLKTSAVRTIKKSKITQLVHFARCDSQSAANQMFHNTLFTFIFFLQLYVLVCPV